MRRRQAPKREVKRDPKFDSEEIGSFITIIMRDGKKSTAQKIVYNTLDLIADKLKEDPLKVFFTALENARPRMAVKPRRIGGATYQVPLEVPKEKGMTIALRWMKDFSLKKKGKPMEEKLAEEIIAAYKQEGSAIKKKEDTHKMADANKAFAHFKY
ncbi:MAG: 30S ribosomal protein S7 [Candidatus Omnitrophica bacterium]|nr:30S ribosomal protein S7 [Candidatus Omnitrophota bacterium]MBU2251169.1 30S ribosomal protein S7 [Candidatus Omnitrophota bacterium]MBU2265447.1 30S ribosomal protein S7 [Candidatus Omnitrophota bacterium]MBU2474125.1 30S ribosomal protein S7 [Candidatus Omnitrophota bacterium]